MTNKIKDERKRVNRKHKDGIFRLLFDSEDKLRELYNGLKHTNYGPETPVRILTLQDAVFIDVKNDLAFSIADQIVVLTEHQSTWNLNMPVRFFSYLGRTYENMFDSREFYKSKRLTLPAPEFYVFYNGKKEMPEESVLRLSDSFAGTPPENTAELVVKVVNVRYNKNSEVLKRCQLLQQYSQLISFIEENQQSGMDTEDAVIQAVRRCRKENILTDFLRRYGSEVLSMLFDVVTKEEFGDIRREEGFEEGIEQGISKGREQGERFKLVGLVCRKLRKGQGPSAIAEALEEEEDVIREICRAAANYSPEYDEREVFERYTEQWETMEKQNDVEASY